MCIIPSNNSHFHHRFPAFDTVWLTSCENQGSNYIEIVSPTVFTQASKWLLWFAWNWRQLRVVEELDTPRKRLQNANLGKETQVLGKTGVFAS
jgi:hypothetical protein